MASTSIKSATCSSPEVFAFKLHTLNKNPKKCNITHYSSHLETLVKILLPKTNLEAGCSVLSPEPWWTFAN